MLNSFWWGSSNGNNKGIKWLSWDAMSFAKCKGGLGFRNFHGFNLSLLGKHCWKFINQPQALVSRVYKARYFADRHLLKAVKGTGASFIWSGLFEAKEVLAKGYRWVLGNGEDIVVTKDPWLRKKEDFKVEDSHRYVGRNETVNSLFMPGTKQWDVNKVKELFTEEDAAAILSIPVPQRNVRDRVAWTQSVDGHYDVKTGYRVWQNQGLRVNRAIQSEGWGKIWRLNIPHKIKVFLWRFGRNNLPVKTRLREKGVSLATVCSMCDRDEEHMVHVFFMCSFASQCWLYAGLSLDMQQINSASEWLLEKINGGTCSEVCKIAKVLWGIWHWRNKKVWDDKTVSPVVAMDWSSRMINEWTDAMKNKKKSSSQSSTCGLAKVQRWKPPEVGNMKVNVDASLSSENATFSVGMVLRDHTGKFIEGRVGCMPEVGSIFEAEAIGIREALSWIAGKGLTQVSFESDSLLSIRALRGDGGNQLEVGHVIQHCLELLQSNPTFSLDFISRQANKVAHEVARCPCLLSCFYVFSSPPESLLETLLYDVSS